MNDSSNRLNERARFTTSGATVSVNSCNVDVSTILDLVLVFGPATGDRNASRINRWVVVERERSDTNHFSLSLDDESR